MREAARAEQDSWQARAAEREAEVERLDQARDELATVGQDAERLSRERDGLQSEAARLEAELASLRAERDEALAARQQAEASIEDRRAKSNRCGPSGRCFRPG